MFLCEENAEDLKIAIDFLKIAIVLAQLTLSGSKTSVMLQKAIKTDSQILSGPYVNIDGKRLDV